MKTNSESGRIALVFLSSLAVTHLGYLLEFILQGCGAGAASSAWLVLLLVQLTAYAAYGIAIAWTRWARADWYMFASFGVTGLAYYFSTGPYQFAYISAALWYGLFISAITSRAAKKLFPATAADRYPARA